REPRYHVERLPREGLRRIVLEVSSLQKLVRPRIMTIELLTTERPSAFRNVVALLEVDRIEGHAATTPLRGRTAELPHAIVSRGTMQIRIRDLSIIQILCRRIPLPIAGLEDDHR